MWCLFCGAILELKVLLKFHVTFKRSLVLGVGEGLECYKTNMLTCRKMSYEEGREIGERLQSCVGALRAGRTFSLGGLAKNLLNTCFALLPAEFCGYFHIKCFISFYFSLPRFS